MQQRRFNWELAYLKPLMEENAPVKPFNFLLQENRASDAVMMEEEEGTSKTAKADGFKKDARQVPIAEVRTAIRRPSTKKMKSNPRASSSRRKSRKAHFTTPLIMQHVLISTPFSGNRQSKFIYLPIPVRKDDEVQVVRGTYKEHTERVMQVYRKKWVIHIERITSKKECGSPVNVGTHPSKDVITKLRLDKDRKSLLVRKALSCPATEDVMQIID